MTFSVAVEATSGAPGISHAQQQAQLGQLLRNYSHAQKTGQLPSALKALGKQIQ